MIDPRQLAERRDEIVESCRRRGYRADVDGAIAAQQEVTRLQTELGEANHHRNEHQKAGKRKLSPAEREAHVEEGRRLKEEATRRETALRDAQSRLESLLGVIPNFVHPDSPVGGESDYRVVRQWGQVPRFEFRPRDHLELGAALDLVDFERAAKVSGQKFYFLKREAALLELALHRHALSVLLEEDFTPYATPDLVRPEVAEGIGFSPRGEETQVYSLANADLCLIGTAEIPLGGLHSEEILDESALPLKLAGTSHCFRTEAGAHGRESRGLYRVHQFSKVEMFVYARPEESEAVLEDLVRIEERIFRDLELPYRVIDVATGDLGAPAFRKFDLEAWMPGRGEGGDWGEVTSASNCTDYQARRLRIRFRREATKKNELVHTLNGTAISCARAILALLENHQRADGSVAVPKALQPFAGFDRIGPR